MIKRATRLFLIASLICSFLSVRISAQGSVMSDEDEIRAAANTYAASPNKKVVVKMKDGRSYKGHIVRVEADHFTLNDPSVNRRVDIPYRDVSSLKKAGPSKGAKTAIWIGVGAGIGALIIFGGRQRPLGTICPLGCGL
jgi:small nuclear ribonucleoprotein (snRNP)-like protein